MVFDYELVVVDTNPGLAPLLANAFRTATGTARPDNVLFRMGNIFEQGPGALVSPANSYGNMDGGIDRHYLEMFPGIDKVVQNYISQIHDGMIPIGEAQVVPTQHGLHPFLVVAPTMEVPTTGIDPLNVRMATRAALLETKYHNHKMEGVPERKITRLLMPGMGTGYGCVPLEQAAEQMALGIVEAQNAELYK